MEASLNEVGLTMNSVTGEIDDALLTQEQSFALAAQIAQESDQEIIDAMLLTGTSAQEAAATIEEANAALSPSSPTAAISTAAPRRGSVSGGVHRSLCIEPARQRPHIW